MCVVERRKRPCALILYEEIFNLYFHEAKGQYICTHRCCKYEETPNIKRKIHIIHRKYKLLYTH